MEIETPRKVLIVSGSAAEVEARLNKVLNEYAAATWNFAVVKDELRITVVLVHQSEMRKAALAMPVLNQRH